MKLLIIRDLKKDTNTLLNAKEQIKREDKEKDWEREL